MTDDAPVILGQQLAAARKAEAERIAQGDSGVSPLCSSEQYDASKGELDLYDPKRLPLDDRLSELCRDYQSQDEATRSATRRSLSMEDLYTLLTFARRSAVFGLRHRDANCLESALTAIAMVEISRVDWRDAIWPLFIIYAISHQLGFDPTRVLERAAAIAEPELSEQLLLFRDRPAADKTLAAAGYSIVQAPGGPGLMSSSICPYAPTVPLDQVILRLAQLLRDHEYSPSVEIATKLPAVWLSKPTNTR